MLEPVPETSEARLASTGLLSFYDRLRERLTSTVDKRAGSLGRRASEVLLLAPDLFILMVRLALDDRVPSAARRFIVGALVYFMTPIDLLPEGLLGPVGYLEDIVLAAALLSTVLGPDLEPMAQSHWNGSKRLRTVLADITNAAYYLLGENLYLRLERLLARRGVRLR